MSGFGKHGLVFMMIAALVFAPFATPVLAEEVVEKEAQETQQPQMPESGPDIPGPDIPGDKMIADVVFVRPISLLTTAVTSTVFVISLPFTILGGNTKGAYKELVAKPAAYTFDRKLGDF